MKDATRILGISGGLRAASTNTALVRALAETAPPGVSIAVYGGLSDLPHFNPDLEGREAPAVLDFRHQLQTSDAVFISSPEYAHGAPGVLKNALDWLVGSGELVGKPVALLNASARSTYAQAGLTETLTVMSARVIPEACVTIPLLGKKMEPAQIAADSEMAALLRRAIAALKAGVDTPEPSPEAGRDPVSRYVESIEQLVSEIVVGDIRRSLDFYRRLGFVLLRDAGDFVELTWEQHRLFLAGKSAFDGIDAVILGDAPVFPLANVRVMVPRVDDLWKLANEIGAKVVIPIGDRYYGLRDFTVADPDGFGIRFASLL
jgi:NAD(P)H-dependent FMN reductase/catechol 2,3-dioxygenase-like lactoylglutathione lyase family enzyme